MSDKPFRIVWPNGQVEAQFRFVREAMRHLRLEAKRCIMLPKLDNVRLDLETGSLTWVDAGQQRRLTIQRPDTDTVCHVPERQP